MRSDLLEILAEGQDGVLAVDMRQHIIRFNLAAERILGYGAEEVVGKPCSSVLAGISEEAVPLCVANCSAIHWARQSRVPPITNMLVLTKAGQRKWLSVTHLPLPAAKGQSRVLVHLFHDVSEEIECKQAVEHLSFHLRKTPSWSRLLNLSAPQDADPGEALTPRELEVLRMLAEGLETVEIAEKLTVSTTTVRNHVQRILSKLDAHSRLQAVAEAARRGLL